MKKMEKQEGRTAIYEIGYLLISSLPVEKVEGETTSLREIFTKNGGEMISEEMPELRQLAYTMVKKIGASNHSFDKGYFGWFKFEVSRKDIESIKKTFEENPNMLRTLIITTIRENTYLGKKSPVASILAREEVVTIEVPAPDVLIAPVSVEEIDKSIDEMVKEA